MNPGRVLRRNRPEARPDGVPVSDPEIHRRDRDGKPDSSAIPPDDRAADPPEKRDHWPGPDQYHPEVVGPGRPDDQSGPHRRNRQPRASTDCSGLGPTGTVPAGNAGVDAGFGAGREEVIPQAGPNRLKREKEPLAQRNAGESYRDDLLAVGPNPATDEIAVPRRGVGHGDADQRGHPAENSPRVVGQSSDQNRQCSGWHDEEGQQELNVGERGGHREVGLVRGVRNRESKPVRWR